MPGMIIKGEEQSMNNRTDIYSTDGILLAYKIEKELPEGLCPYSNEQDFLQVLSWNYQGGTKLKAHRHLPSPRNIAYTQEAVVVISGRVRVEIFDLRLKLVKKILLATGECLVFLHGGHSYEILEDKTRVFEIKNGPYPGAEADRRRFKPCQQRKSQDKH